eukprot:2246309-Pyramimonas_sp.AAC.1
MPMGSQEKKGPEKGLTGGFTFSEVSIRTCTHRLPIMQKLGLKKETRKSKFKSAFFDRATVDTLVRSR